MPAPEHDLLDFRKLGKSRISRAVFGAVQAITNPVFQWTRINQMYRDLLQVRKSGDGRSFFDQALSVLDIHYSLTPEDQDRIPENGPVFMVANHPYGAVDGIIMGSILERVRPDSKLLVNSLLQKIDDMGGRCLYVNPFGGPEAKRENLAGIKASLRWLGEGHALATFPSGTVSHLKWGSRRVTDPVWADNIAALIRRTGATVVPLYFEGRNRPLFQIAGLLHERFRTLLLPREMIASQHRLFRVRVGNPISARRLQHFSSDREVMDFLRLRTYILQSREVAEKTTFSPDHRTASTGKPIRQAQPLAKIEEELADLPEEAKLIKHDMFTVYAAKADRIPHLVLELGRLREITFRAVGEGTGEESDLDRFDSDYWHLFIWNHEEREIVGAYRLGLTDEILPLRGKNGLYTTTLFRFRPGVLRGMNPAIELGRSFIVETYQRKPASLGLLWKGIGQFIVRHPKYCTLFGPVSISKEYQNLSKNLMVAYLKEHSLDPELSGKVRAKRPPRSRHFGSLDRSSFRRSVREIEDVSALISEIEKEERGVPVLLRQYLKLNATVLSFNVDPAFNDSLDGLLLVDLRRTEVRVLRKYMGVEGASRFLAYHQVRADGPDRINPFGSETAKPRVKRIPE